MLEQPIPVNMIVIQLAKVSWAVCAYVAFVYLRPFQIVNDTIQIKISNRIVAPVISVHVWTETF
jgi:hypothetical protein